MNFFYFYFLTFYFINTVAIDVPGGNRIRRKIEMLGKTPRCSDILVCKCHGKHTSNPAMSSIL